jgi:hypothetical protein
MSLDTMFTLEVVLMVVLVAAAAGGAIYLALSSRRARREMGGEVGTTGVPVGTAPEESAEDTIERVERTALRERRREFYKSMGLETTEDIKLRLYSIEEYQDASSADPMLDRTVASWLRPRPTDSSTASGTTTPRVRRLACSNSHRRTTR